METYSIYPIKQMDDNAVLKLMQRMQDELWDPTFLDKATIKGKKDTFRKCYRELMSRGYEIHKCFRRSEGRKIGCDWSFTKRENQTYVYYLPKETYHNNQCTTRAMSRIIAMEYLEIRRRQDATARRSGRRWNDIPVTTEIMNAEGYVLIQFRPRYVKCGTVARQLSKMRGIIRMSGHVAAFVEGKVYDSFDCTDRYAKAVFVPKAMEQEARNILAYWGAI